MAKLNGNTKRSIRIGISLIRQSLIMAFEKTSLINLFSANCPYCPDTPDCQRFFRPLPLLCYPVNLTSGTSPPGYADKFRPRSLEQRNKKAHRDGGLQLLHV